MWNRKVWQWVEPKAVVSGLGRSVRAWTAGRGGRKWWDAENGMVPSLGDG